MRTLRTRFVLSHLIPLLVIVPLAGLVLLYLLQTQVLLTDLSGELNHQANLIAAAANGRADIFSDTILAQTFVTGISTEINGRVTLLHPSGELLASSDPNDQPGEQRPVPDSQSVQSGAQSNGVLYSLTRQVATISIPILNVNDEVVGIVQVTDELQNVSERFRLIRDIIVAVLVGQLLIGGLMGLVLALRLERPIHNITTAVTDIATGQPIKTIPDSGLHEIRQLGQTVNDLATKLHKLEESRRRLLANLVHELGRPLGALRSAVHVLRGGADEETAVRHELLEGMEQEIERMMPLLDDLTRLHGQVLGTLALNQQEVDLNVWLPSLLQTWRAAAFDNGLDWQTAVSPNLPTLHMDPDRIAQALGNLISNAIKYTPSGGKVTVKAESNEQEVWLQISDSGPGIIVEEQTRIFEPFFRSQQERRFPKGLGLGLTIAYDSVLVHNGRLTLDSTPGQGSTFTIHLPCDRTHPILNSF